ncbi:MAG: hypothetical protein LC733_07860, partial [Actinobacteria bacterium]|nr:hypothetical protein [Actinomycetota bacterium]
GSRVVRSVELRHVPAGQPATMEGRMDSVSVSAKATLSSDWIVHVWARGLAVVEGAFVLEVTGPGERPGSVAVQVVRWEGRQPGPGSVQPVSIAAEVARGEDGWTLVEGRGS